MKMWESARKIKKRLSFSNSEEEDEEQAPKSNIDPRNILEDLKDDRQSLKRLGDIGKSFANRAYPFFLQLEVQQ
jgi:hypothetical protein